MPNPIPALQRAIAEARASEGAHTVYFRVHGSPMESTAPDIHAARLLWDVLSRGGADMVSARP